MIKTWRNRRRERRRERVKAAVLGRLLLGDRYTVEIWRKIGGSSGDVYVALAQLEAAGVIESRLEVIQPWETPRPPRRWYRITEEALRRAS